MAMSGFQFLDQISFFRENFVPNAPPPLQANKKKNLAIKLYFLSDIVNSLSSIVFGAKK